MAESRRAADAKTRVLRILDELTRTLRRSAGELDRARERAEHAELQLATLKEALASDTSGRLLSTADDAFRRARLTTTGRATNARRRADATQGATKAITRTDGHGRITGQVDGSQWFNLPPLLARLFLTLTSAAAANDDGFPCWMDFEVVARSIAPPGRPPLTRRAVIQAIYRLRRTLDRSGSNGWLLQVDRAHGLRFLVRIRRGL